MRWLKLTKHLHPSAVIMDLPFPYTLGPWARFFLGMKLQSINAPTLPSLLWLCDILSVKSCKSFSRISDLINQIKVEHLSSLFVAAGFQEETSHGKKVHLKCSQCKEVFGQAWDLMFHVQNAHGVNIYKLSEKNNTPPIGKWIQRRRSWRDSLFNTINHVKDTPILQ